MRTSLVPHSLNVRYVLQIVIAASVYYISAKLGLKLAFVNPSTTPVWPPTGIALALLILSGYRFAPAVFLGAFFANVTNSGTIIMSLLIALGNTLEAIAGACLVSQFAHGKNSFKTIADVLRFTVFAGFLATMISASVGITSLVWMGAIGKHDIVFSWITWWLGDMGGALVITPCIIVWSQLNLRKITISSVFTVFIVAAVIFVMGEIVFSGFFPFAYVFIPMLIWLVFRYHGYGGSGGILLVSAIAIYNTLHGSGPFVGRGYSPNASLLLLQVFMGTASVTSLVVSATLSERDKIRKSLEQSEYRFRALIEKSSDAVALIDANGIIVYAGPSTERILGYPVEEFTGLNVFTFIHPDDIAHTSGLFEKLLKNPGGSETAQYRMRRKDGSWVWIEGIGTNLLNDPHIQAIANNYRDITEWKRLDFRLEEERDRLRTVIDSSAEGIIVTDRYLHISMINKKACDLLEVSPEEAKGVAIQKIAHLLKDEKEVSDNERLFLKAFKTGKSIVTELYDNYSYRAESGKSFPVILSVAPIFDNETIGIVNVFRDVSELKALDEMKTLFLSLAAHQLRTPLGIMRWQLEMLLGGDMGVINDQVRFTLNKVTANNLRMIDLVNDFLNVSYIDQGKFVEHPKKIYILNTLDELVREMQLEASKYSIKIIFEHILSSDLTMVIDPGHFRLVFQNLLSNAIKYNTQGGSVTLRAISTDVILRVAVQDTGIGILDKDKKKLFSKFFRGSNASLHKTEGSGLGLYVVKWCVDHWGGNIMLASVPSQGTTITVELPLQASH